MTKKLVEKKYAEVKGYINSEADEFIDYMNNYFTSTLDNDEKVFIEAIEFVSRECNNLLPKKELKDIQNKTVGEIFNMPIVALSCDTVKDFFQDMYYFDYCDRFDNLVEGFLMEVGIFETEEELDDFTYSLTEYSDSNGLEYSHFEWYDESIDEDLMTHCLFNHFDLPTYFDLSDVKLKDLGAIKKDVLSNLDIT